MTPPAFQQVLPPGRLQALLADSRRPAPKDAAPSPSSPLLPPLVARPPDPPAPYRTWGRAAMRAIESLAGLVLLPFTIKPLRRAAILAALILAVWAYAPYRPALASVVTPLHQRAAYSWEERFDDGLDRWVDASALIPDRSGAMRVEGLAMPDKTPAAGNYEVDFSARIQKKSLGWVVRTRNDAYTFKLTDHGRTPTGRKLELTRPNHTTVPVVVPGAGDFLDISVRVTDDQVLTSVNGYGVDAWKHPKFQTSSVGLLAEKGESFLVKSVTISGNEDLLGVFLKNLMSLAAAKIG